ncbi:single-stranded DNA-binding protein [Candidatus Termititenax persephonae]|uniref:Single-stranded DNA-binding protein n=1 Tax=Candidatus Termititenax persephonae TaxID=2218525 RepID=A0A388TKJ5_9BACT|nr:single-stranded DNA-binding protein [Candidatus Termititenax persephonae]
MKSYNNVTLVGRAVRDPDFKDAGNVNARTQFTLAVDRPYKDADGKHPTDFLNVVAWQKLAEICHDYIKKGCLVLLSGRIQSRSYALDGETKWITEIIAESVNILEYHRAKTVDADAEEETKPKRKKAA